MASFARVTLELMSLGASPQLLTAYQSAAADEIRHAEVAFEIARGYGAEPSAPGRLPLPSMRPAEPERLALDTFMEGCVAETIAAVEAGEAARRAEDSELQVRLQVIAEDEANHAVLAWETLAFLLEIAGPEAGAAIRHRAWVKAPDPDAVADALSDDERVRAAHGLLPESLMTFLASRTWHQLILPMLDELLEDVARA
mgnify:CR=1 FL=1